MDNNETAQKNDRQNGGLRKTGLELIGDLPWATHFCQFSLTKNDLLEILAPYFRAGLENNEMCILVTSDFLNSDEAKTGLEKDIPGFDDYLKKGQMELIPYTDWYLLGGKFEMQRVLNDWVAKHDTALARGFEGLRVSGNPFWINNKKDWDDFAAYEAQINNVIGAYKMLVLCTYSLEKCGANEVIDVVNNHEFALIKRDGEWTLIESEAYKKMKETLNESERRYGNIFNSMTEGFALSELVYDSDGKPVDYRFIDVNPGFEKYSGLKRKDVVGKLRSETSPANPESFKRYCEVVLTGQPVEFENYEKVKDKYNYVYAFRSSAGQFATIFTDITERKYFEKKIEHLASFPQLNPNPIIELDMEGNVIFCNESAKKIANGEVRQLIPEDLPQLISTLKNSDPPVSIREINFGGRIFKEFISLVKNFNSLRIYAFDVTDRRRAEEDLRKSEEKYRNLVKYAPAAIYEVDFTIPRYTSVNDVMCEYLGYTREELLSMNPFDTLDKESGELFRERIRKAQLGEKIDSSVEYKVRAKDGREYYATLNVTFKYNNGKIVGAFVIAQDITERKLTEEALLKSEEDYRNLVKQAPAAIYEMELEGGKFLSVNDVMCNILGYSREELLLMKLTDLMDDEGLSIFKERINKKIEGEKINETVEYRIKRKDEKWIYASVNVGAFAYAGEKPSRVTVIAHDVTERKQAEEALAAEREKLQKIFDAVSVGIVLIDENGSVKKANEVVSKLIGEDVSTMYGRQPGDVLGCIHARTDPRGCGKTEHCNQCLLRKAFETTLKEEKPVHDIETRSTLLLGEKAVDLWFKVNADPLVIDGGKHAIVSLSNITERKQAEEELRETKDYLENLFDYANAPIIVWDTAFKITRFNHAFERLTKYSADEVIGKDLTLLFPQDSRAKSLDKISRTLIGEQWDVVEIPILRKDGQVRIALWNSANIYDKAGKNLVATIAQGQDITERKIAEEELRLSEGKYRGLFDGMSEGFALHNIIYDGSGNPMDYLVLEVNDAYEKITGMAKDKVVDKKASEIYGTGNPPFLKTYAKVAATGNPASFEVFFPPMAKYFSISVFSPAKGKFATVFQDITERRRAQEILTESENRYRLLFETMFQGVVCHDANGKMISMNAAAEKILGRSLDEIVINNEQNVIKEDGSPFPDEEHPSVIALRTGREVNGVVMGVYNPAEKARRWVVVSAVPVFTKDQGSPVQSYSLFIDITERKLAEQEISRQREWLSVILGSIGDGVLACDTAGKITFINPIAASLTGWKIKETIGQPIWNVFKIMNEKTLGPSKDIITQVLEEKKIVSLENHTVLVAKDGSRIPIEDSAAPITDASENMTGVVLVFHDVLKKRRAEEELRETKDYLENLIDYANAPIIVWSTTFKITRFNRAFERLTGLKEAEVLGKNLSILFPESGKEEAMKHIRQAVSGEYWNVVEIPILKTDGSVHIVLWNSANIKDKSGRTVSTIAQGQDITKRKIAEDDLSDLNKTLRALSNSNQSLMRASDEPSYLDDVCKIIVNDCQYKMVWIGYAQDDEDKGILPVAKAGFEDGYVENLKLTWADTERGWGPTGTAVRTGKTVICKDMLTDPKLLPWREQAIKRGYSSSIAIPLINGGKTFGVITIYSPSKEAFSSEEIKLLEELASDLSFGVSSLRMRDSNKLARERLIQSEERFRQIADIMPNLVWTTQPDGIVDYVNRSLQNYSMNGPKTDIKWSFDFVHEDDRPSSIKTWQESMSTGEPRHMEHRLRRIDGSYRWHLSRVAPIKNDAGQIVKWLGTSTDINEIKEAQENLKRSGDEKNRFISIMSHELRNPLTPILAGIELIQAQLEDKENNDLNNDPIINESANIVEQQAKNMARLLDDLLDISRISLGRIQLKKEVIKLNDHLKNAVTAALPLIEKQNHEIIVSLAEPSVCVEADPIRLEQIVINLLNNSAKYMEPGGHIWLNSSLSDEWAEISVKDEGIGIEPESIDKIFDSFADSTVPFVSTQGELGVGLKLAKELVALHGGTITATSGGKDKGCEFVIRIPTLPTCEALPASKVMQVKEASEKKLRVLVIDDNESIAQLIAKTVAYFGHDSKVCCDGTAALDLAREYEPDIVLVDIGMPKISGYEIAKELRQLEQKTGKKIGLAALTGYGQEEDKQRSKDAGFDVHLVKPVDLDTLKKTIHDLSQKPSRIE